MTELPKLPGPHLLRNYGNHRAYYTAEQMLQFQRDTLEACAKVAETAAHKLGGYQFAADGIRNLLK